MHAPFFSLDGVLEIDELLTDDEKGALLAERDRMFPALTEDDYLDAVDAANDAAIEAFGDPAAAPEGLFDQIMWGWLTPEHVAIAEREARTGDIPLS